MIGYFSYSCKEKNFQKSIGRVNNKDKSPFLSCSDRTDATSVGKGARKLA